MSILIVQLGDIHFEKNDDPAVSRSGTIGAAISAQITSETKKVVIAVCGDAAYSGKKSEFEIATEFLIAIENEILSRNENVDIVRATIPGNHDCDFSGDQAAREGLLTLIKPGEKPQPSITNVILKPLKQYFKFAKNYAGENSISDSCQFYQFVDIEEGGKTIRLHLLNTAWMSEIREVTGSLSFPLAEIEPPDSPADLDVSLLHHPINWFSQPQVMRQLRDRLSEISTVILVNHEHTVEARTETQLFGMEEDSANKTCYVSGGVIQEWGHKEICTFVTLDLDLQKQTLQLSKLELRENGSNAHFKTTESKEISVSRNELSKGAAGVTISAEMKEYLEEPGAPINHPYRDPRIPIKLSDVFMFPDFWELDEDHNGDDQRRVKSDRAAETILSSDRILITGDEKSGRSAIAKQLFLSAFKVGKIPLLFSGQKLPKKIDKLKKTIRSLVKEQYTDLTPDQFEQCQRDNRVAIIDDVHLLPFSASARCEILEELERLFRTVVVCGNNLIKVDEMSGREPRDSGLWEYKHLVILGFSESLREEFVRRWLLLGFDVAIDDDHLKNETDRICDLLNVVVKKQLLPAYPLYLLVLLQQSDLADASVQSGNFGKLFDGLVTAILNTSTFNRITIQDKYSYLASLSRKMYDSESMVIPEEDVKKWHRDYWDQIELEIDFQRLVEDLHQIGLVTWTNGSVQFRYAYFFCFFVAHHIQIGLEIGDKGATDLIVALSKQLHHRISADIILFVASLNKHTVILDELVKTCDSLFVDAIPATLDSDVAGLNNMGREIEEISIPEKPELNRIAEREARDKLVGEHLAATRSTHLVTPPEPGNDLVQQLYDLNASFKTIQILGQVIRNVGGRALKDQKSEVLNKIIGLSRRILGKYLAYVGEDSLNEFLKSVAEAQKEHMSELNESELKNEVCQHINGMLKFFCFSVIKHTTFSIGSENLAPTIRRVLEEDTASISKLMDLSLSLDQNGDSLVQRHLNFTKILGKTTFRAGWSESLFPITCIHTSYHRKIAKQFATR